MNADKFLDSLKDLSLTSSEVQAISNFLAEPTDCQKLATLIAGLQKAYYESCETCKPAHATGPAVCDLANFAPKVVE